MTKLYIVRNKKGSRKHVKQPEQAAPTSQTRRARAYEQLGIDEQKVTDTPKITPIISKLPGGIQKAVEFLRGVDSDEARKWLSLYDDMPVTVRKLLPFEAFCLAANITTKRMLEMITGACFEQSDLAAKLIARAAQPAVVAATVRSATSLISPSGFQDRKMLHTHSGFLPIAKNSTTFIAPGGVQHNAQITGSNNQIGQTTFTVAEISGIERKQGKIADRFNERLGLGTSEPSRVIDVTDTLESTLKGEQPVVESVTEPESEPIPEPLSDPHTDAYPDAYPSDSWD